MASGDGFCQNLDESVMEESRKMSEDDDDEDEETWDEMHAECESFLSCLFCTQNFKTMAVALEHCKTDHNFNLTNLKNKFNMDCYSYICMINYVRKEGINPDCLLSLKEPMWLNEEYLAPVIQDDPWLMFDFEGLESPTDSGSLTPKENYHVVNSENGLVTLTEQHFVQLQHKIKHLSLQVQEKEEALSVAAEQIEKMKVVTQNLVCGDSSDCLDGKEFEKKILKRKLSQDDVYFNSYSHFGIHHEMLSDKIRTSAYRDAVMNNTSLISSKLILDVGCGTGILSMFAAAAGASKVFGVDQSEIIYNAMDIIRENNLSDKIELFHEKVEDVSLPVEKVDVIISEWMGCFLLFEGMLDSVITARNRFLKTDGYLLPNQCILYIIGISDSELHEEMLGFWSNVYGFKMSCLVNEVIKEAQIFQVKDKAVLTSSAPVLNLDLHTADPTSTDFTSAFSLECLRDGSLTALCGYFDAIFDLPNPSVLSTSPISGKTHWKQTVFFLQNPIPVSKGSIINGNISCKRFDENNRALCIRISLLDPYILALQSITTAHFSLRYKTSSNLEVSMETHNTTQTPSFGGGSESNHSPEANSIPVANQAVDLPPMMTEQNTSSSSPIPPPAIHIEDLPPPKLDFSAPPPYELAAKLPTYEEVQREKTRLGEPQINNPSSTHQNPQSLAFLAIDTEGHDNENESGLLGTDFMFFTAFLVAFLFNWIGFLLLMCFCHTIAARYGALSGFGLSLAKWTFIVKHSTDLASRENSWLWWLIMAFGLLIFVRAIIQYLNIKRGWRFLSGTAQERLLFFY